MYLINGVIFCVLEPLPDSRLFEAVLKYGVAQWSSIGLAMGFSYSQIEACTSDKPAPASKLEAIICLKARDCSIKETEECLLTACKSIPQPIIGSVREYMESGSGKNLC